MADDDQVPDSDGGDTFNVSIEPVPKVGTLFIRLLGPPRALWTHWRSGRAHACRGDGECDPSLHRLAVKRKAYCAAEYLYSIGKKRWIPCVFEMTEGLIGLMGMENRRGEVWRVTRFKISEKRSECRGVLIRNDDPRPLRRDIDVESAVQRLYSTLYLAWDLPAPFGVRQRLDSTPLADHTDTSPVDKPARLDAADRDRARRIIQEARNGLNNGNGHKKAKPNA